MNDTIQLRSAVTGLLGFAAAEKQTLPAAVGSDGAGEARTWQRPGAVKPPEAP